MFDTFIRQGKNFNKKILIRFFDTETGIFLNISRFKS